MYIHIYIYLPVYSLHMHVSVKEWKNQWINDLKALQSPHFGQALCLQDTAAQQIKSPPQTATLEFSRGAYQKISEAFDAKLNKLLQKSAEGTVIWSCCPSRHVIFTYFIGCFSSAKNTVDRTDLTADMTWPDIVGQEQMRLAGWSQFRASCTAPGAQNWHAKVPRELNVNPQKFIPIHDPERIHESSTMPQWYIVILIQ